MTAAGRDDTRQADASAADRVVEVLTEFFDALERGDREATKQLMTENFERTFEFASGVTWVVEGRTHFGVAGMQRYIDEVLDAVDLAYEKRETHVFGDSLVVFLADVVAHGHASGAPVRQEVGFLFRHRDGLVTRGLSYASRQQALTEAEEIADASA